MSDDPDLPVESDRVPGAPHPRETRRLVGQDPALAAFRTAAASGRMHHGWLITGPRGTGKATLAWVIARWLLAETGSPDLSVPEDHPVARRLRAMSEPRLHLVRRSLDDKGRLRAEIVVEDIRKLLSFFHMSAAEGGRRIAIIDAADDMNTAAANAVLKMLEEPPEGAVLLLVAHQPARLLPTIRSRCRELRLMPLSPEDMATALAPLEVGGDPARLAALAGGSVGEALRLSGQDGLDRYADLVALFARPEMDRQAAAAFAQDAAGRPGAGGDPFDLTMTLLDRFLSRAARTGLMGAPLPEAADGESAVLARISPDDRAARHWASAQAELSARARAGRAVNLDPVALVMDMLLTLAQAPGATEARGRG
ncbi:DNA polymerase III subunit delta' [Paracoccus sp. (in: a-proteobacteria)]|uniref:DNA polymerase III subunit delta' n=1 Tax=Paracoccus sp. TaxID=267 RepID=UPI0026DF4798|nr:DNA polymerase III subunit delta' [Paracoccus sp. (in: a-proteobacteria)]MDO5369133.1 DNA polymerase III subunit delta' [Paracoccus sp. (in: a-proteobacteria)]